MESVTNFSSPKKNQQAEPTPLAWFSPGPATALLVLILGLVAFDAMQDLFSGREDSGSPGIVDNNPATLPYPGAALLWFRPLDINSASLEELDMLPGVGEKGASRMLNFRMQRGFLLTVGELKQLSGPFGSRRYAYLESYLRAGP